MESNISKIKTVFVSGTLAITLGVASFISMPVYVAEAEPAVKTEPQILFTQELKDKMTPNYMKEGYSDYQQYKNDLDKLKINYDGKIQNILNSSRLTEEQREKLVDLENRMQNAALISSFNEYAAQVDSILVEIQSVNTYSISYSGNWSGEYADFMRAGVVHSDGNKYTYYSESVLPGGGLKIPGRHTSGGFVRDADGYIVLANDDPIGTVIETPWGTGRVYDRGTSGNHYDVYVE